MGRFVDGFPASTPVMFATVVYGKPLGLASQLRLDIRDVRRARFVMGLQSPEAGRVVQSCTASARRSATCQSTPVGSTT